MGAMRANGPAIRAIRERSGLTQQELADLARINGGNFSKIEAGTRAGTPIQLAAIAAALRVPLVAIILEEVST